MVGVHSLPSAYTCLLGEASSTGVCNRTLTRFGSRVKTNGTEKSQKATVFESVFDVVVELLSEFPLLNKRAFPMRAYFLPTNAAVSRACFRVCSCRRCAVEGFWIQLKSTVMYYSYANKRDRFARLFSSLLTDSLY